MEAEALGALTMEALSLALLLSGPVVATSLAIGLMTAFFQSATQLQEPTLGFVPRLAAVGIALILAGGWMGAEVIGFTETLWRSIQ